MRELVCRCCGRPDVAGWLRTKGYNISPQLDAQLGRALVWRGQRVEARNLAQPESVFRRRLAKKGLPTPARVERWWARSQGAARDRQAA
mgnify:CR=1 FL=1